MLHILSVICSLGLVVAMATSVTISSQAVKGLPAGEPRQLTTNPAVDIEPKWSPDGNRLSFASERTETWNVWTIGADGSGLSQLTFDLEMVHSTWWSPDGSRLAIAGARRSGAGFVGHVYTMPLAGGEMTKITSGPVDGAPCWSPDGRLIAFVSNRTGNWDIWVIPAGGGEARQITSYDGLDHSPRWSPDGKRLAFHSARSGNGDIWIVGADGGDPKRLTTSEAVDHFPSWSPDGKHVAFHSNRSGHFDIWAIPVAGGEAVQLTSGPHNDMRPSWSPDGNRLAFTSDRAGNDDIWVLGGE